MEKSRLGKYKLIKWYPSLGSLKVGDVVQKWDNATHYSLKKNGWLIELNEVQNNPEFWEEVFLGSVPIFVSKDGVNIVEGQVYYKVSKNFKLKKCICKTTFRGNATNCKSKYFYFLKNAKKYIILNKPCLSYEEIYSIYREDTFGWLNRLEKFIMLKKINDL